MDKLDLFSVIYGSVAVPGVIGESLLFNRFLPPPLKQHNNSKTSQVYVTCLNYVAHSCMILEDVALYCTTL